MARDTRDSRDTIDRSVNLDARSRLTDLMLGAWAAQALSVFVRLAIPDVLKDEAMVPEALAEQVGADPDSLGRLLRALTSVDVVERLDSGGYRLTGMGQLLRSDGEGAQGAMIAMVCDPSHWMPWGSALDAVVNGAPVSEQVFGKSFWDYIAENSDQQARFNRAMTDTSKRASRTIAAKYDFSQFTTVVDVGGGQGILLQTILREYPHLKGILFDLPQVLDSARVDDDLKERIELIPGSFLETAPGGGDLYMMKHIIHDWGDDACLEILKNIRAVIPDHGRILISDAILPGSDRDSVPGADSAAVQASETGISSSFPYWLDLNMMIILGGRERTEAEFAELLAKTGFEYLGVVPTDGSTGLVEARPAPG